LDVLTPIRASIWQAWQNFRALICMSQAQRQRADACHWQPISKNEYNACQKTGIDTQGADLTMYKIISEKKI
jgi:hypothetical protein